MLKPLSNTFAIIIIYPVILGITLDANVLGATFIIVEVERKEGDYFCWRHMRLDEWIATYSEDYKGNLNI